MTNTLQIGSYSSGTMVPSDLISTFMGLFEEMDAKRAKSYRWANRKYFNYLDDMSRYDDEDAKEREEMLPEIVDELFDILNEYCPPYTYFGASEGDGADYGVWVSVDSVEDDVRDGEICKVDDLSELDEKLTDDGFIPRMVLVVNDHGNMTLYSQTATLEEGNEQATGYMLTIEREEVWAIV